MEKPSLERFKQIYNLDESKKFTGVSPTGTKYAFIIDEEGLNVYYAILDGDKLKGTIRTVNLKKFVNTNKSMTGVPIGKDDALSTDPTTGNQPIIDEITRIKGLAAEKDRSEGDDSMPNREKLINDFAKRFVTVKLDETKKQADWKRDILASIADGSRWHVEQPHTNDQRDAILGLNRQMIDWAVEDAAKSHMGRGIEEHNAIVGVLADELVKVFPDSEKSLWERMINYNLGRGENFGVARKTNKEQDNVIAVVNSFYPDLQRADKREKEIVALAERANQFLNSEVSVDDWKKVILTNMQSGDRWTTTDHPEHSADQKNTVLEANRQFIAWAIEDKTLGLKGKDRHNAIVSILADEMVKVGFSGTVKQWIARLEDSCNKGETVAVEEKLTVEQRNVLEIVNQNLATLHAEETPKVEPIVKKKKTPKLAKVKAFASKHKKGFTAIVIAAIAGVSAIVGSSIIASAIRDKDSGDGGNAGSNGKPNGGGNSTNVTQEVDIEELRVGLNERTGKDIDKMVASVADGEVNIYGVTEDQSELVKVTINDVGNDGKVTQEDLDAVRTAPLTEYQSAETVLPVEYSELFENFDKTYFSVGKPDGNGKIDVDKIVLQDDYVIEDTSSCVVSSKLYTSDKDAKVKVIGVAYNVADYEGYRYNDLGVESTVVNNNVGVREVEEGPELG